MTTLPVSIVWIFFPIAITLHNLEEAIWLPNWSRHAKRFHKPVEPNEFFFALIGVTVLAYLCIFLAIAFPSVWLWRHIFFGFLGTMILNTFVPHLISTIVLRRYSPGLFTGLFLLVPINSTILYQAVAAGDIQWFELLLSTVVVTVFLLSLLPLFFQLGKRLVE